MCDRCHAQDAADAVEDAAGRVAFAVEEMQRSIMNIENIISAALSDRGN